MGSTVVDVEEMYRDMEAAAEGVRGMIKVMMIWPWIWMAGRGWGSGDVRVDVEGALSCTLVVQRPSDPYVYSSLGQWCRI